MADELGLVDDTFDELDIILEELAFVLEELLMLTGTLDELLEELD